MSDHLLKLEKYTKEAEKLYGVQPLAAYYLRLRAATQAMRIPNRPPDVTDFLQQLLQQLEGDEQSKATPSDEAFREIQTMALKILADADDQYQARKATKQTVLMLKTSYLLIDSLRAVTGETVDEDLCKKEKYAQIKAIEIRKALQEGRVPGPPMSDAEAAAAAQHMDASLSQPPRGQSAADAAKEEADLMRELEGMSEGGPPPPPAGSQQGRRPSAGGIGWPPRGEHGGAAAAAAAAAPAYGQPPVFSQQGFGAAAASAPPPPGSFGAGPPPQAPMGSFGYPSMGRGGGPMGGGAFGGGSNHSMGSSPSSASSGAASAPVLSIEMQARQTAAFTEAERKTKHALAAMRFEDTDTTIDKLYEVIELLRPFGNRHRR